jgi:hypothetical protein
MITLSGQRFVGVSQVDETQAERSKRVEFRDTCSSTCGDSWAPTCQIMTAEKTEISSFSV